MANFYIPRQSNFGGNPWQGAANAYGNELDRLGTLQQEGMTQTANAPMTLYKMFMEGFEKAQEQKRQEEADALKQAQLDRQNRLADIQEQRATDQGKRSDALNSMGFWDHVSKMLTPKNGMRDPLIDLGKKLGVENVEKLIPSVQYETKQQEMAPAMEGASLSEGGEETTREIKSEIPGSGWGEQAWQKEQELKSKENRRKMADETKLTIARMKDALARDPDTIANREKLGRLAYLEAKIAAGGPEAEIALVEARAELARINALEAPKRTAIMGENAAANTTRATNSGEVTEKDKFKAEQDLTKIAARGATKAAAKAPATAPKDGDKNASGQRYSARMKKWMTKQTDGTWA